MGAEFGEATKNRTAALPTITSAAIASSFLFFKAVANYLGFVILTKPIIAQIAPNTTNRLKNAPTPSAMLRSIEFCETPSTAKAPNSRK